MAHTRPDTPHVGVPIPKEEDLKPVKPKPGKPPKPGEGSVGPSPVTGQTADRSKDAPGQ